MSRPDAALAALGAALLALMLAALSLHVPGADNVGSPARVNLFVAILAAGAAVYLAAIRLVLRQRVGRGFWVVIGVAVLMRAALLPATPFLSSDVYRYVWDGRVQAAGINPYAYVPADPALAGLRDATVYPMINRAGYARTIYPPMAQLVFAAVGRAGGGVLAMKLAMVGFEALAVLCLVRLLALAGLPRERVLIYAWNPLALWSFAGDGHVDAAAIGLLGLALLAAVEPRLARARGLAGGLLAAAALVKFIPLAVAPAFLRGRSPWRPALAGLVAVVVLYLPYLSAGRHVLGFLPGYGAEEGLDSGSGVWLLAGLSHLVALPPMAGGLYLLAAASAGGALALWIARRPAAMVPDGVALCRDTGVLAACATAALSPHYGWYFAWLALPAVVAPLPAVIWLSVSPVLLILDPLHERFFWPCLVYLPALGLAAAGLRRGARPAAPASLAAPQGTR